MEHNNTAGNESCSGDKPNNHNNIPSSVQKVVSNNDLITEILLRLPDLSLIRFKSVSKHWFSLIKDASFISRRNQFPKLDPPCGMFLKLYNYYEFVPCDTRVPVCSNVEKAFTFGPPVEHSDIEILHSCNGLLLCRLLGRKIYVCNPSVSNMFKLIPYPDDVTGYLSSGCLSLAFDPTESPHYKIIYGRLVCGDLPGGILVEIYTYSSETEDWSLFWDWIREFPEGSFKDSVYWKDAIYWLNGASKYSRLEFMNGHLVVTTLRTPLTLDVKVHYECRLLESQGCLLLVGKDYAYSRKLSIYEKKNVNLEWWSMKYIVDLDDVLMPSPRGWSIRSIVIGIILGGREEDSFLVLKLDTKVVQHKITSKTLQQKIMSKTLCTISNLRSDDDIVRCFHFIPSIANL